MYLLSVSYWKSEFVIASSVHEVYLQFIIQPAQVQAFYFDHQQSSSTWSYWGLQWSWHHVQLIVSQYYLWVRPQPGILLGHNALTDYHTKALISMMMFKISFENFLEISGNSPCSLQCTVEWICVIHVIHHPPERTSDRGHPHDPSSMYRAQTLATSTLNAFEAPSYQRTPLWYIVIWTQLLRGRTSHCTADSIYSYELSPQFKTARSSGQLQERLEHNKLDIARDWKFMHRVTYRVHVMLKIKDLWQYYHICPNRSAVRKCKGLGTHLLISTI